MKNFGTSLSFTLMLALPALGACNPGLSQSDQDLILFPDAGKLSTGGGGSDGGSTVACPDDQYEWTDGSGKIVCALPVASANPGDQAAYDPGMPDPSEYTNCDLSPTTVLATQEVGITTPQLPVTVPHPSFATKCMAGNPPLFRSLIELYKFDIMARKVKIGEHSTSRVTRFRWDWDAATNAYKAPVEDAKTSHSNHWAKDDARLKRYRMIDTKRTDVNGAGFKAYSNSANTYCPCTLDVGHKTDTDSCYGFASANPFEVEIHVCHSDTIVQVNNFQSAAGAKLTLTNVCGRGLVDNEAPVP